MALTIIQQPEEISPAGNPVIFLLNSTNAAQSNFRFIAVIKNGSGAILGKRKFPLIPGTSRGWIDIHRLLESYVSETFNIDQASAAEISTATFAYSVEFGEEYGSPITEYLGLATAGNLRAWNASLQYADEFPGYDSDAWRIVNPPHGSARWLSAYGNSKRVAPDQRDYLSLISTSATGPTAIKVVATLQGGGTTTSIFAVSITGVNRLIRIPSGPQNLNLIPSLISGTPGSVIPANTASYTIQARIQSSATDFGPVFTYRIRRALTVYEPWDLFFLNRYGGMESHRFDRRSDISRQIERRSYERAPISYDGSGAVGYSSSAGSLTNYATEISKSVRLVSDWITEEESLGLLDLISSPLVYSYHLSRLREVAVQVQDHRERRKVNEKLEAFELVASFALKDRRQTR